MNFTDTLKSVELVMKTKEVALIVGESGIGKTALAKEIARKNNYRLIVIDANLLKEGEIGGLPTIDTHIEVDKYGNEITKKSTVYAVHNKLIEIDKEIAKNKNVLLFIDEINRCEHTVQQELMNLILNREINGYKLHDNVNIIAAMNPSNKYNDSFDYQVVDMDLAQENRFVWFEMDVDYVGWIKWAVENNIEEKVISFISTFPEYLYKHNTNDIDATPRSYERISKVYSIYKENIDEIPKNIFLNIIKGNVGKIIAEEFVSFIKNDNEELISFEEIFDKVIKEIYILQDKVQKESHSRLYISSMNILRKLENKFINEEINKTEYANKFIEFIKLYPIDLRIGIMKDIKMSYKDIYKELINNEEFVKMYFDIYSLVN